MNDLIITRDDAVQSLMNGGVGVMPTDTVYGLVARAEDPQAVVRLYALKSRDHKPGTIVASSINQLRNLGVSQSHLDKAEKWWPNSLSIILPFSRDATYLHQGVGDIAIRVPSDLLLRAILERTGPLLTTSANQPGEPGAVTTLEAWNYFKDTIDFYVDGNDLSGRAPSTIIRFDDMGGIKIVRQGTFKF